MAGITVSVDFGIVVALKVELDAVLSQCSHFKKEVHESEDNLTYHVGCIHSKAGEYKIAVTLLPTVGNVSAAVATKDLLARYSPSYVIMIGIAGGASPKSQNLGDVLVSEEVLYYELAKVKSDAYEMRTKTLPANPKLLDRARNFGDTTWNLSIQTAPPRPLPRASAAHIGPIASGEKVVANSEFLSQLLRANSKIIGVEMESWGVVSATHSAPNMLGFLGIRGISDFADSQKSDNWQRYAAESAASWAIRFLESGPVAPKGTLELAASPRVDQPQIPRGVRLQWNGTSGSQWRVEMNEVTTTDKTEITTQTGSKSTTSEKFNSKRAYDARVLNVRKNGVFRMQFTPVGFDMSTVHTENGILTGSISPGKRAQVHGEGLMLLASALMSKLLQELMEIDLFFEVTPNGKVISAESTKDPFRSGNYIGNSPFKGMEYFQWISTGRDQPDIMAVSFFVQTPSAEVREGSIWRPQVRWNTMGMEISGSTMAELKHLDSTGHGSIAHVSEVGQLSIDTSEFVRNLKAAFLAEEPEAEIELHISENPTYATQSEWSFDVENGELQSKRCPRMDMKLGMAVSGRKGKMNRSMSMVIHSGGSNTVTWSRK